MGRRKERTRRWEGFNREFWQGYNGDDGEGPVHILWFDRTGTFELKNNIVVEIELKTRGYADHYVGYEVRLIHKTNGQLTSHFFKFDDYLSSKMDDRIDDRKDYPLGGNLCYYATAEAQWYIAIPEFDEIATYQSEVMTFIETYGDVKPRCA
jgi:hypothetical protein